MQLGALHVQYFNIHVSQKERLQLKMHQAGYNWENMNFDEEEKVICEKPTNRTCANEIDITLHKF